MTPPTPLPVHLITGLLGSGKTTTLKQLIKQKPDNELWGFIINEFGEIDIDAATLSQTDKQSPVLSVAGGCVCCTAQHGLSQAITQLLSQQTEPGQKPLSRLWIEPTGLGHPAKIIDTLTCTPFARPLNLQQIVCVITPQQLTLARWQKSTVMRDLVTLADILLLNKTDLSKDAEIEASMQLLAGLYPAKQTVIKTCQGQVTLKQLIQARQVEPLTILSSVDAQLNPQLNSIGESRHKQEVQSISESIPSSLPGILECIQQRQPETDHIRSIGWLFNAHIQFSRVKLKAFFTDYGEQLSRAKGILKTGNEWQLVNWTYHHGQAQLTFEDIAWRQDSRLECIFSDENHHAQNDLELNKVIEIQLLSCISKTQ